METHFTKKMLEDFLEEIDKPRLPRPIEYHPLILLAMDEEQLKYFSLGCKQGEVCLAPAGEKSILLLRDHLLKNNFVEVDGGFIHKSELSRKMITYGKTDKN